MIQLSTFKYANTEFHTSVFVKNVKCYCFNCFVFIYNKESSLGVYSVFATGIVKSESRIS